MGFRVDKTRMDEILHELSEKYDIYAPCMDAQKKKVRFPGRQKGRICVLKCSTSIMITKTDSEKNICA